MAGDGNIMDGGMSLCAHFKWLAGFNAITSQILDFLVDNNICPDISSVSTIIFI